MKSAFPCVTYTDLATGHLHPFKLAIFLGGDCLFLRDKAAPILCAGDPKSIHEHFADFSYCIYPI